MKITIFVAGLILTASLSGVCFAQPSGSSTVGQGPSAVGNGSNTNYSNPDSANSNVGNNGTNDNSENSDSTSGTNNAENSVM
jgi:ABC-type oligopeptide transport system substrate-binding subunit